MTAVTFTYVRNTCNVVMFVFFICFLLLNVSKISLSMPEEML